MLGWIRTTKGLGNSEVYLRLRGVGADLGKFYDFVGAAWVTPETSNCHKLMTEYADSDSLESLYAVEFTPPTGGPFVQEAVRVTGGGVLGSDITALDALVSSRSQTGDKMDLVDAPNATAVAAIQNGIAFADGYVYIDTNVGVTGTDGIKGSTQLPVNNMADAKTISLAKNLSQFKVLGCALGTNLDVVGDFSGYLIKGIDFFDSIINVSGTTASFENLQLEGDFTGGIVITATNCLLAGLAGISGQFIGCGLTGDNIVAGGTRFINCYSFNDGTLSIDSTGVVAAGWSGPLTLVNGAAGSNTVMELANGATITIDSTCTGGTYTFTGNGRVINNGTGCTVNDYTTGAEVTVHDTDIKAILNNVMYGLPALQALVETVTALFGTGDTAVDHNTGGLDNMRVVDSTGAGIDNVEIKAYLKTDYDAGNIGDSFVKARSYTSANGRWAKHMNLDTGFTYTFEFFKQGVYDLNTKEVAI